MAANAPEKTAFPSFDDEQMDAISGIGEWARFEDGDELIAQGQKDYPFFVVKSGRVRIVERDGDDERPVAMHGPGEFTGDVDMLTGRSSLFVAVADGPVEVYRLGADKLRRLLLECPRVSDVLLKAFQMRRALVATLPFRGVQVFGDAKGPETMRLQEFLYKNHVPNSFQDASSEEGREQIKALGAESLPLPVVRCNGSTLGNPPLLELAACLGIRRDIDRRQYQLVVIGAGPAGLATAVYAASEGIRTLVVDTVGPGGQAGSSSKIENFIGFPSGLSGAELARRGFLQALKFGAEFVSPVAVESIDSTSPREHLLQLSDGQAVRAESVLVATGVSYRQLNVPGCRELEGAGVYYAATSVEARVCAASTAVVVGGGNSAGQAAMFLAEHARDVQLLIRGDDLGKSMSAYLCQRIEKHPGIQVRKHTELAGVEGKQHIQSVQVRQNQTGQTETVACSGVFVFIGAKPHTDWLPNEVLLDSKEFILTGSMFYSDERLRGNWTLERPPCDLETTVPGILAAGDVRAGTTKRCGFAVGDGSLAVSCLHRVLGT